MLKVEKKRNKGEYHIIGGGIGGGVFEREKEMEGCKMRRK